MHKSEFTPHGIVAELSGSHSVYELCEIREQLKFVIEERTRMFAFDAPRSPKRTESIYTPRPCTADDPCGDCHGCTATELA